LEEGGPSPNLPRPESPSSGDEDFDIDWNFAKREAALARLGLDPSLDNLPDDDLNKLFEKITRVKTMRDTKSSGRPESSMSGVGDDVWSEGGRGVGGYSGPSEGFTDDTSVYASPALDSSAQQGQHGGLRNMQNHLESRLLEMGDGSTGVTEAEDLKAEKDHMEHQLRMIRVQMKRIVEARSRGEDVQGLEYEPVLYSARQLKLIRKVLDRWRAKRAFSMAEVVLTNAVAVKEANIIRFL